MKKALSGIHSPWCYPSLWFSINQPLFLQKTKILGYFNEFGLGCEFWLQEKVCS